MSAAALAPAAPEAGTAFGDAWVEGPFDPSLLAREITLAAANSERAVAWRNRTITIGKLVEQLCTFERGTKDGNCILQGELVADGRRANVSVRAMYLMIFDIDTGATLAQVRDRLPGDVFYVLWNTHSHNKTQTFIAQSALLKWMKRRNPAEPDREPTVSDAAAYLVEKKKARASLFDGATLSECRHESDGVGYQLQHKPWPKLRVLLLLDKPFVFLERGGTHDEALAEWKAKYLAAAKVLGLEVDEACKDPGRLFFTPRIPEGAPRLSDETGDIDAADIEVHAGKPFDLDAVTLPPKPEKTAATDAPREAFKTTNLSPFLAIGAKSFRVADWIRDKASEDLRHDYGDGRKIDTRCPLEDGHTNASPTDRAFVAKNGNGDASGFQLHCQHETCKAAAARADGKHDRAVLLDELCALYDVHDASELIEWCDDAARTEWAHRNAMVPYSAQATALAPSAQTSLLQGEGFGFAELLRRAGALAREGWESRAPQRALQPAPAPIVIKWVRDQSEQPGLPWLIEDLMLGGSWGFLVADTGLGKTFILVYMALCLETGRPFFGRKIRERGGTIVIVGEGAYSTKQRFEAARRHGFPELKESTAGFIDMPPDLANPKGINERVFDELIERLREASAEMQKTFGLPLKLVQFDTFAKCFPNLQEDKSAEAIHAHTVMERIAKTLDVAVICAAHIGKDADRGMRGSSSHKQNAHFMLTIPKPGGALYLQKVKDAEQELWLGRFEMPVVKIGAKPDGTSVTTRYVLETPGLAGAGFTALPKDKGDGQKALRAALADASDGSVKNPVSPGAPAAHADAVRGAFCKAYPRGKGATNRAWQRVIKDLPENIRLDEKAGIIYACDTGDIGDIVRHVA